ncbi:hypothetical protein DL95DRAFT_382061, partial [Leptodontidium sp. 2 PMI_412]
MVILGDVATSDAVEGDEDRDEDYNPRNEEERDDIPRAVRGEDHGHDATVEKADEEVEEEAPNARASWSEVPSMRLDQSSEQQSIDRAEAIRNKEAYQAMTANAVPLVPPPSEQPSMQTPTRKRTRPFEIAASDDSSSFDPISPQRYANSTPRRSAKRVRSGTPLSGSRRMSAPTGWSPRKGEGLGTLETFKP